MKKITTISTLILLVIGLIVLTYKLYDTNSKVSSLRRELIEYNRIQDVLILQNKQRLKTIDSLLKVYKYFDK